MVSSWIIRRLLRFPVIGSGLQWSSVSPLDVPMKYPGVGITRNHRGLDGRLTMQESFRLDMLRESDRIGFATGD